MKLKSLVISLLDKIKEKWLETVAIFVIGLGLSFSNISYNFLIEYFSSASHDDVIEQAKRYLGQGVDEIKFQENEKSGIITILAKHPGESGKQITVLHLLDDYVTKVAENKTFDIYTDGVLDDFGFVVAESFEKQYIYIAKSVLTGTCCIEKRVTIYENQNEPILTTIHEIPLDSGHVSTFHYGEEESNIRLVAWVNRYLANQGYETEFTGSGHKEWERINYNERLDSELIPVLAETEYSNEGCTRNGVYIWSFELGGTKATSHYEIIANYKEEEKALLVYVGSISNEYWSVDHGYILLSDNTAKYYITSSRYDNYMLYTNEFAYGDKKFFHTGYGIDSIFLDEPIVEDDYVIAEYFYNSPNYTICSFYRDSNGDLQFDSSEEGVRKIISKNRKHFSKN